MGLFREQMRTLPGDHNRPLHQNVVDVPPEISRAARATIKEGSNVLERISTFTRDAGAPEEVMCYVSGVARRDRVADSASILLQFNSGLHDFANAINEGSSILGGKVGGPITDEVQAVADEVALFMGVGNIIPTPPKYLTGTRFT